ncbi:MAG: FtsX-like permease family protein [Ruminococcus sp.]|nr:FtsX-like permease family protein [Ruminococcus sp.]
MKQILRNIRMFLRREKMIFTVMVICIFSSALILNFAYGLYQNFNTQKMEDNADLQEIVIDIDDDSQLTRKEFQTYIESLSEDVLQNMTVFVAGTLEGVGEDTYNTLDCRFEYYNGKYKVMEEYRENIEKSLHSGRMITDEEENSGAYVALVSYDDATGRNDFIKSIMKDEDTIILFGREYEIIGEAPTTITPSIPFLSVPEDFIFDDIVILSFDNVINKPVYEELKMQADTVIPEKLIFPELDLPDPDSITLYNNIILISLLIAVLSLLNFAMLYHFVLEKRSRDLAIMRICGCTKRRALLIYLGECAVLSVPVYLIGTGLFILLLDHVFDDLFIYMKQAYSMQVYLIIFIGYILLMLLILGIMISRHISKTILQEWKEG